MSNVLQQDSLPHSLASSAARSLSLALQTPCCGAAGSSATGKESWFNSRADDGSTPADWAGARVNELVRIGTFEVCPSTLGS